jgi:hypothetical protein
MGRNSLNFMIDVLSGMLMVGMISTGLIVRMVLPPGSGQHRMLWGLTRHEWGGLHFALAIGLLAVLLVHLAMHWQWIYTTMVRWFRRPEGDHHPPRRASRAAVGAALVGLTIVGFAGFVWTARANVVETRTVRGSERAIRGEAPAGAAALEPAPQPARQRLGAKEF